MTLGVENVVMTEGTHLFEFRTTPTPPNPGLAHVTLLEYVQLAMVAR